MKKNLFALFAIVLAVAFSSFTNMKKAPLTDEVWFEFIGTDASDPNQLSNPNLYQMDGDGSVPTVCEATNLQYICEILIEPTTALTPRPDFQNHTASDTRKKPTVD
jgi:hypothetical protein